MSAASLAGRVKARREELGLAQGALPGLDQSTLSRIESGKMRDPGFEVTQKLAAGLGLSLEELATGQSSGVRGIALADLIADPANPRTIDVDDSVEASLVESIRTIGLVQALTVKPPPVHKQADADIVAVIDKWMVVDGHRRFAALVAIHGPKSKVIVPCRIVDGLDEGATLLMQLVANVQSADMNPMDLAAAVARLVDGGTDTQAIAEALNKGRRWVQEQASVGHHLTADGQDALRKGVISISQAVALAAERNEEKQNTLMARASLQNLNEEEIRAIIAADREAEAIAKVAEQAAEQPELLPKATVYPTADANGVFQGKPTYLARWPHSRGELAIELVQFGDHKWCAAATCSWRASSVGGGGYASAPRRDSHVQRTAAIAFLDCARDAYKTMLRWSAGHPEDLPAMRALHDWVDDRLVQLGATDRVQADWRQNNAPPAKPKAQPAAPPKASKQPKLKELSKAEVLKLPSWAAPLKFAYFVIGEGGKLTLLKGWKAMATMMWQIYEQAEPAEFWHSLRDRKQWADDLEGKPFDFAGIVSRVTHVKVRP